jgi:hypothetical protein
VSGLEDAGRIKKEVQMQRFTNPRVGKASPRPVRRPTRPSDKLSRRRAGSGALLAVVTAVVTAIALTAAGTAGAVGRYPDASGDGKGSADVTGVSVMSDTVGQIIFTISTAADPKAGGGWTAVFLDTDANPATGALGTLGADYLLGLEEGGYDFGRWTGSDWDWNTPYTTVRVNSSATGVMFSVNRSELGGTASINFWARNGRGDPVLGQMDDAPDDGTFNYTLAAGGPDIREVGVKTTPDSGPRAGRTFTVQPTSLALPVVPANGLSPQPESYTCSAKLGAKTLRGRAAGGCTFAVPKQAKGKRLSVSLTASYQGASKTIVLTYKVR